MSGSGGASTMVGAGGGGGGEPEPGPGGPDREAPDCRPMTYDEKRSLSLGINKLPGMELRQIVKIIQETQPSMRDTDSDEFEIDFETLKPRTLRALEQFLRSKLPSYDELHYEQQFDDEL